MVLTLDLRCGTWGGVGCSSGDSLSKFLGKSSCSICGDALALQVFQSKSLLRFPMFGCYGFFLGIQQFHPHKVGVWKPGDLLLDFYTSGAAPHQLRDFSADKNGNNI